MKKSLPAVRVSEKTLENIAAAIKKFNEDDNNILLISSIQEFRRFSYELLSQMILQGKKIPVKLK